MISDRYCMCHSESVLIFKKNHTVWRNSQKRPVLLGCHLILGLACHIYVERKLWWRRLGIWVLTVLPNMNRLVYISSHSLWKNTCVCEVSIHLRFSKPFCVCFYLSCAILSADEKLGLFCLLWSSVRWEHRSLSLYSKNIFIWCRTSSSSMRRADCTTFPFFSTLWV